MLAVRAVLLLAVPLLAGCAAVTAADGRRLGLGSSEFRGYVEGVFRGQNATASELAFAIEGLPIEESASEDAAGLVGAPSRELPAAEDALLAACEGLNELAASRRDGERLGLRRRLRLAREAPECERATLAARAALGAQAR
jgi:hypothetical protein